MCEELLMQLLLRLRAKRWVKGERISNEESRGKLTKNLSSNESPTLSRYAKSYVQTHKRWKILKHFIACLFASKVRVSSLSVLYQQEKPGEGERAFCIDLFYDSALRSLVIFYQHLWISRLVQSHPLTKKQNLSFSTVLCDFRSFVDRTMWQE
jgi:hypothetical protein